MKVIVTKRKFDPETMNEIKDVPEDKVIHGVDIDEKEYKK